MDIKFISKVGFTAMIGLAIFRCGGNGAENKNRNLEAMKTDSLDTFLLTSKLPKGATTLHNLPANIQGFVQENYPGYSVTIAVSDPLCNGDDAIDVAIVKTGSPGFSLIFKPDGTFVQQEQDVPLKTAPLKIQEILKTKYADYSTGNQIEKSTLANKTEQYQVDLNKNNITKELIFSADGVVVCEN